MKILCKLGLHKWESLKSQSKQDMIEEIENNLKGFPGMSSITRGVQFSKLYRQKVCLNCEKYINDITPQYNKIVKIIKNKLRIINNIKREE